MKIRIEILTLEPGRHIGRRDIATREKCIVDLPDAECMEVRADWGEYLPVVTFPAIERGLRSRGLLENRQLLNDEIYRYGIVRE